MNAKYTQEELPGMVTVSEKAFFATVGKLDVNPSVVSSSYAREFGYRSDWLMRDRRLVGVTVGGNCFSHCRYMVTQSFFDNNRAAIAKAKSQQ